MRNRRSAVLLSMSARVASDPGAAAAEATGGRPHVIRSGDDTLAAPSMS